MPGCKHQARAVGGRRAREPLSPPAMYLTEQGCTRPGPKPQPGAHQLAWPQLQPAQSTGQAACQQGPAARHHTRPHDPTMHCSLCVVLEPTLRGMMRMRTHAHARARPCEVRMRKQRPPTTHQPNTRAGPQAATRRQPLPFSLSACPHRPRWQVSVWGTAADLLLRLHLLRAAVALGNHR